MRRPHAVPLSQQALELLLTLRGLKNPREFLFPSLHDWRKPICENNLNNALKRLGYDSDEMTPHGFRAMASTLLNESGL